MVLIIYATFTKTIVNVVTYKLAYANLTLIHQQETIVAREPPQNS